MSNKQNDHYNETVELENVSFGFDNKGRYEYKDGKKVYTPISKAEQGKPIDWTKFHEFVWDKTPSISAFSESPFCICGLPEDNPLHIQTTPDNTSWDGRWYKLIGDLSLEDDRNFLHPKAWTKIHQFIATQVAVAEARERAQLIAEVESMPVILADVRFNGDDKPLIEQCVSLQSVMSLLRKSNPQ